ncbi:MAG: hypothetical protein ACK5BN_21245 [Planctomycetota bacterium]
MDKPRALLGALLGIGESPEELRAALLRARAGSLDLPPGCSVTYDVEAIDVLTKLLPKRSALDRLEALYDDFRERHGRRPMASEMHAMDGSALRAAAEHHGSWLHFVGRKDGLNPDQRRVAQQHADFFHEVATSRMERAYKMLVLQALMELSQMPGGASIDELAVRFRMIAARSPARSNPGTWVTLLSGHMGDSWCWPCGRHRVPWPDAMDPDRARDGATTVRAGRPAP